MIEHEIVLPSKPKIISEEDFRGVYEIEGLYPGYGQTLGNSLRRIILSSLMGTAITSVKIAGALHEFSTLDGIKEDAITIILNLKKIKFRLATDEPQTARLSVKGAKKVAAGDLEVGGQLEIVNKDEPIATLTEKEAKLEIDLRVERGLGYIPKEVLAKDRAEIGTIWLDASFTPIRRVSYEVENMRVGDRTDYNRLRLAIETDGSLTPREALEKSIIIMINQLKAIVGFKEDYVEVEEKPTPAAGASVAGQLLEDEIMVSRPEQTKDEVDFLKTRIEDIGFSARIMKVMAEEGIRTIGGLARKRESDLRELNGLGEKAIDEIKKVLKNHGITLKE